MAITVGINIAYWLNGPWNLSDTMTKQIPTTPFRQYCDYLFLRTNFHLRDNNCLDDTKNNTL